MYPRFWHDRQPKHQAADDLLKGISTAQLHQRRHQQRSRRLLGELSVSRLHRVRPGDGQRGERLITLNVNGQERRVDVMKQETLARTLRYKLGLTGTKLGCDRAECGACTVLIDDVPHYSCSVLTHTVRGKKSPDDRRAGQPDGTLHPVQQGVVDEQGFQCAFCMSGFVMATVGYLKTNPNPSRAELAHGISGNLCRCQDYDKILTAMMRGAENMRKVNHA